MTWVITRLCQDCVDMSCAEVCPVSCIVKPVPEQEAAFPGQLFIDPAECIDCGACEPECPWEAIYEEDWVPPELAADIAVNAQVTDRRDLFMVPDQDAAGRRPTPEEIAANRRRWGVPDPITG